MAKTHMKKFPTFLDIKEMQTKTILRFYLTPVKTPPTTNVGEDAGKRNPHTLLVGMQASTAILENNTEASSKIKHRSAI
jgi:hypothetical protein